MKSNKAHYLCLFFLLAIEAMHAQSIFKAGYVIDLKNDTLFGEIDYRGDLRMSEKCTFKSPSTGLITEYTPDKIAGYRFKDDRFFIAKEIKGKKVFLEFLIKGRVNVYCFRNASVDNYFIEREGEKLSELPYSEGIVQGSDNLMYLRQTKTHKYILKRFMKDAPAFQSRIDNLVKPEHNELIRLAKDYHNQVCKDEACIVYKKKIVPITVDVEIVGGYLRYTGDRNVVNAVQKNYLNLGVLAHVWLPRTNEKLYLRTGIVWSRFESLTNLGFAVGESEVTNIYKMPLQIEYIYPKGRIRPTFAYGLNIYKPITFSVGFMGGLNVKLSEKVALGFSYDLDFLPYLWLPFVPDSFSSHSGLLGLKVKL